MKKEKIVTYKYYIILILLLLSLFVALNYCKKFKVGQTAQEVVADVSKTKAKVESTPEQENVPVEGIDLDLDSELVLNLQKKINVFDTYKAGSYYGYFYSQDYMDFNTMSDDAKILIGITQTSDFTNDFLDSTYEAITPDEKTIDVIILSKEEIQNGINRFFGPNTTVTDTDLKDAEYDYCGFSRFRFDSTRNVYMSDPISCQAFPLPYIDTKIVKAYEYGNIIELTIKVAYIKYEVKNDDNIIKYIYKTNSDSKYIEKHNLLTDNSYNIDKILNKLDSFKFTFNLNSDNYYYFTKVEKIS